MGKRSRGNDGVHRPSSPASLPGGREQVGKLLTDWLVIRERDKGTSPRQRRLSKCPQGPICSPTNADHQLGQRRDRDTGIAIGRSADRTTLLSCHEDARVGEIPACHATMSSVVSPTSKSSESETMLNSAASWSIAARSANSNSLGRRSLRNRRGTMSATGRPWTVSTTGSPPSIAAITRPVWFRNSRTDTSIRGTA